jgi:hypothetical protein
VVGIVVTVGKVERLMQTNFGFPLFRCQRSGKIILASHKKAKQFAVRQARVHGHEYKIYRCKFCKEWHLATVKEKKR